MIPYFMGGGRGGGFFLTVSHKGVRAIKGDVHRKNLVRNKA